MGESNKSYQIESRKLITYITSFATVVGERELDNNIT